MWLTVLCRLLDRAQCVIVSEVHSVYSTINMQRKCVNSSDAFCYICNEVTFKSQRRSFTPLIRNATNIISAAKWVIMTRVGLPIFVVWHVPGFLRHGQKVHAVAFRHSYGLERAHGPCFRLLPLPDQYHWCNSKVQTHCSISKFTICDEASTSQCGVTCAKASNKLWRWVTVSQVMKM